MKRILYLIPLLILITLQSLNADTNVSGNITTNTTWNLAGSPYIVIGNVLVQSGVTLTIDDLPPFIIPHVNWRSDMNLALQNCLEASEQKIRVPAYGKYGLCQEQQG